MTVMVFVDTNVLIYAKDLSEKTKHETAKAWLFRLWQQSCGRLSFQVLNEYYAVVTGRLSPGRDPVLAREDIRNLITWQPVPNSPALFERAWQIEDRYKLSWWDSLIVGAARISRCSYLLTDDLQHRQQYDEVTCVNPFQTPISEICP